MALNRLAGLIGALLGYSGYSRKLRRAFTVS
jgi:hypothetical protein